MTQELFERCINLGIAHRLNDDELAMMLELLVADGDVNDFDVYAAATSAPLLTGF